MTLPIKYSLRSLWGRRTTTFSTAGGVALVVFVLAACLMLLNGLERTLGKTSSSSKVLVMQTDAFSEAGSRLRKDSLAHVQAAPGVLRDSDGAPRVTADSIVAVQFTQAQNPSRIVSLQVRGVSPNFQRLRPEVRLVAGRLPRSGTDEAMVGRAIVSRYGGLHLGGSFALKKNRDIRVVGVFEAQGMAFESEIWADIESVQSSLGWQGFVSSVTAELASPGQFDAFKIALESDKRLGYKVEREAAYYSRMASGLTSVITALGGAVTLIFSIGAMLGASITMYAAVNQRTQEIGVLRALGFGSAEVLTVFLLETGLVALSGASVGVLLSCFTPLVPFATVNAMTGNEVIVPFVLSPGTLL
ncbi:MAG TPA: ABC transporter permease, partial [Polyangiaceae bacterium]|nr:ABC transporter permease [Polyangiaceae bacterium]